MKRIGWHNQIDLIRLTFRDLERSDQDHLLKSGYSYYKTLLASDRSRIGWHTQTFRDLERSDQGQLLKNRVSVRDSAIVTIEHYSK